MRMMLGFSAAWVQIQKEESKTERTKERMDGE
jgi:hypothetical protein